MMTDVLGRERYRLDRLLGIGAMGTVQLGRDTVLDRAVAVKVLADHLAADEDFRRRFLQEARLAARLCHPNIVQVFDAGEDGGCPFIVMEYVEGQTVAERLAGGQRFTADELTTLAIQLAAGLAHAHARGVVHRDVKPHNVLLRQDGAAKLTDFGIARAVEERGLTEIGTVLGTAPFMAPEQAAGRAVGPAADVFALGALLRHCAAGRVPAGLAPVVEAMLAPDPAVRPPAAEIRRRLLELADGGRDPSSPNPSSPSPSPSGAPDCGDAIPTVVAPALAPPAAAPSGAQPAPDSAPTERRTPAGTQLLPPPVRSWLAERWPGRAAPLIAAAVLVLIFALTTHLRGAPAEPTPSSSTAPAAAGAGAGAAGLPAADPVEAAHDLANWLRTHSK
jgi:serine/threonine protein kinase